MGDKELPYFIPERQDGAGAPNVPMPAWVNTQFRVWVHSSSREGRLASSRAGWLALQP